MNKIVPRKSKRSLAEFEEKKQIFPYNERSSLMRKEKEKNIQWEKLCNLKLENMCN